MSSNKSIEHKLPKDFPNEFDLADKIACPKAGDCPYTLLLGAGASFASGIQTGQQMIKDWKTQLLRHIHRGRDLSAVEYMAWDSGGYEEWMQNHRPERERESEYSFLFKHFRGTAPERQIYIEQMVDGKMPSFGYLYLAGLIRERRFNCILTTNFDDLLNDALTQFYGIRAVVCAFDSAVESIRIASLRPKIIKLHGDFLYDNLRNVGQEVMRLGSNMEEKLLHTCKEGGLVVVGYQGEDESVMAPIQTMVRSSDYLKMGLHWCVYSPSDDAPVEIPERVQQLVSLYPTRVTIYTIRGFDQLMEIMFNRCGCQLPNKLTDPRAHTLYRGFYDGLTASGQAPYLTPGMLLHVKRFRTADKDTRISAETRADDADEQHSAGCEHISRGDFDAARACFQAGLDLIEQIKADAAASMRARWRARKRETGHLDGMAEVDARQGKTADAYARKTLQVVKQSLEELEKDVSLDIMSTKERLTFWYNGLCALAILAEIGSLSSEDLALAIQYRDTLRRLDPSGREERSLRTIEFSYRKLQYRMDAEPLPRPDPGEA